MGELDIGFLNHFVPRDGINHSDNNTSIHGWVVAGRDRGSVDILWSSLLTIILCVWVATHPNALLPKDKWYHGVSCNDWTFRTGFPFRTRGSSAFQCSSKCQGMRGFPFHGIRAATDQIFNGLQQFQKDSHLCGGQKWTYKQAFFVDMGGIFLKSPDFPERFPIDAEQLHYLVKHGFVDFSNIESMDIAERNTVDTFSRLITLWQALWFFITEMDHVRNGLPITALELTALSFTFAMVATFVCWYPKPAISYPRYIETKVQGEGQVTLEQVRTYARSPIHPQLSTAWHRTPLDDITPRIFRIDAYWCFYKRLGDMMHLHPLWKAHQTGTLGQISL
ncbi:hypothetical protein CSAL01_01741 [Colletotrichum salicis]|uniref:Uncharacterized protein n=1 Tax=Colletotrichum salicis TaxID=1209931 RepID=A0A135V986_9PEZI|nr:hypothetical protein CSAL01_01741 [Colletotrichum salicis]